MANQENTNSLGKKVASFFKAVGNAIASVWNGAWGGMEKASVRFEEVYELRDFRSTSGWGIGLSVLAIACGIFHLNINSVTDRIAIGGSLFDGVGDVFLVLSLLLLIAGTLTASSAGLLFIFAGMTLPAVGEIINIVVNLCTGNAAYIVANWLYLVTFLAFAAVYVLSFTKVISVKIGKIIIFGASIALIVYAILAFVFRLAPFFGDETIYVTKAIEYVTMVAAMLMIHLTVFDYSSEYHVVSKAVEKDDKEEF